MMSLFQLKTATIAYIALAVVIYALPALSTEAQLMYEVLLRCRTGSKSCHHNSGHVTSITCRAITMSIVLAQDHFYNDFMSLHVT